jgi:hypothetical protein
MASTGMTAAEAASQQATAKVLAAREKQISERIDKDFFAEDGKFR